MRATPLALLMLFQLGLGACIEIPGLQAGDPCNPNGICAEGLRCVAGTCQAPGQGRAWRQMDTPRSSTFYAVWGRSALEVYAAGTSGVFARYDGSTWQEATTGTSSTFYALIGDGSDVWVGGASGLLKRYLPSSRSFANGGANAEVYDDSGKKLSNLTVRGFAASSGALYAIASNSSNASRILKRTSSTRWDQVGSISGMSARVLLAAGKDLYIAGSGVSYVARWNVDSTSLVEQVVLPGGQNYAIYALWSGKMSSGKISANDMIVAGDDFALTREGGKWMPLSQTAGLDGKREYRAIWGSGVDRELVFVGEGKYLGSESGASGIETCEANRCAFDSQVKPDGSGGWKPLSSSSKVYAVWGDDAGLLIAGGAGGLFRRKK